MKVIVEKIEQPIIKSVTMVLSIEEATLIASVFGSMTTAEDSELELRSSRIYNDLREAGLGYPYKHGRAATMTGRLEWRD